MSDAVRDPHPGCLYCGGTGWHHRTVCFCRWTTSDPPDPEAVRRQDAAAESSYDDG